MAPKVPPPALDPAAGTQEKPRERTESGQAVQWPLSSSGPAALAYVSNVRCVSQNDHPAEIPETWILGITEFLGDFHRVLVAYRESSTTAAIHAIAHPAERVIAAITYRASPSIPLPLSNPSAQPHSKSSLPVISRLAQV
ncbi:hypothetical protein C8034_v000154 [Colletotrichum sidae]|uniref:Uncharacterized protein n=1 Tax=Colletotrichum sidae TaxID=1347389 RepID=A0A4R8SM13_9PEZI|nr:hypothetical protein C8034_v000154 [Colletotrichum sidae]